MFCVLLNLLCVAVWFGFCLCCLGGQSVCVFCLCVTVCCCMVCFVCGDCVLSVFACFACGALCDVLGFVKKTVCGCVVHTVCLLCL